jgi:hypothetical protein
MVYAFLIPGLYYDNGTDVKINAIYDEHAKPADQGADIDWPCVQSKVTHFSIPLNHVWHGEH